MPFSFVYRKESELPVSSFERVLGVVLHLVFRFSKLAHLAVNAIRAIFSHFFLDSVI